MNGGAGDMAARDFQTSLPPGRYCDVTAGPPADGGCPGRTITVGDGGWATIALGPLDAVAIHRGAALQER
jgi:alpha-amylase